MAKYQYKLVCNLKIIPKNFITVADKLEISLPCIHCQRTHRTIIFEGVNKKGICTPSEKCTGFPGSLLNREIIKQSDGIKINFLIEFDYQPFVDLKYKVESKFENNWARVYFSISCPECQKEKTISTQENLARPFNQKCECGNILFREAESPFEYILIEIN